MMRIMDLDKTQAAAISAWSRFDSEVKDPTLRAVSAAFGLIACADGDLDSAEVKHYVSVAQGDARFQALDAPSLETALRSLAEALTTDVDAGRERALELVRACRGDDAASGILLLTASIALEADDKVTRTEVAAMRSVCEALGVDPKPYLPDD